MSKTVRFGGKTIKKPGAYSRIVSGIKNGFINLPFGGLLVIDTGSGAGYGGGAGIGGTLQNNGKAIYNFTSAPDFQEFVGGGIWYKLAEPLFFPNGINNEGISYIDFVRACNTIPAEISMTFTGGGSEGGTIVLQMRNEGLVGNGYLGNEVLATAKYLVTSAGSSGNSITLKVGTTTIGTFTNTGSTTIAQMVAGLASNVTATTGTHGYIVVTTTPTYLVVKAPLNSGDSGNALVPSVVVTGSATAITPSLFGLAPQVDKVTLTGSSGTANIPINGTNYLATFNTDLTTTAADFVITHAATILADEDIIVTSALTVLTFTANTAGTVQTILTPINASGNLAGTVAAFSLNGTGTVGVDGTELTRGFSGKMVAGTIDSDKYKLTYYKGTYTGLDTVISNGEPFNGIAEADTKQIELVDTPEFASINEIQDFLLNDFTFNQFFKLKTFTVVGGGTVDATDLTNNSTHQIASGGTETYGAGNLNTVLDYLKSNLASFILLDKWGADAQHARNLTILAWNNLEARYPKEVYVGGGKTEDNFVSGSTGSSIDIAVAYNNENTTIVHAGTSIPKVGGGLKDYDSIYNAANWLGREAGIEPQVPLTQKQINIAATLHPLSDKQQDLCIDRGILATIFDEDYDPGRFVCLKGVNTLQDNENLVNENSTSASKQLRRIIRQLNKELIINAKRKIFGDENGVNRNTLSITDISVFVQDFLSSKIATPQDDNLIILFQNINVKVQGDAYYVSYEFEPNFEVNFLLMTGVLIDPNS